MLPCGRKLFVHMYESKTLNIYMIEIKILIINFIYVIFFEYATWHHDIGD